jgi:hypothetical protein
MTKRALLARLNISTAYPLTIDAIGVPVEFCLNQYRIVERGVNLIRFPDPTRDHVF